MADAPLFQVMLTVLDENDDWAPLADATKITPDVAPDQVTTLTFDYPFDGVNADLLTLDRQVQVRYRDADGFWQTPKNGSFRISGQGEDRVTRGTATWTARSLFSVFDSAVLLQDPEFVQPARDLGKFDQWYPRTWPNGADVGQVLCKAILESSARHELAEVDTTYVYTEHDSNGNPWTGVLNAESREVLTPLSDLVQSLTERDLVSIQFDGRFLKLLDPATVGRDRTNVELVPARDITEAPLKISSDARANRCYVKGDNASYVAVDAVDLDPSDVRAVTVDASGISDPTTLRQIGMQHLLEVNRIKRELTIGLDCWASRFVPWRDFDIDDVVTVAYGGGRVETAKVKQITVQQDEQGVRASIVLGDRLLPAEAKMARELRAMRQGSQRALGSSGMRAYPATSVRPGVPLEAVDPAAQKAADDALKAASDAMALAGRAVLTTDWGSNADAARPGTSDQAVYWRSGTVEPKNAVAGDFAYVQGTGGTP